MLLESFVLPVVPKQNKINFESLVCEEQHTEKRAALKPFS